MKSGYKKIINIFLILFISAFAVTCAEDKKNDNNAKSDDDKIPDSLITDINPEKRKFDETLEEYQTRLAGKYNVKKRTTTNYIYDLNGNLIPEGAITEEIIYDNKGRRIEHIIYKRNLEINYKWNFGYDENNNMVEFSSYDNFGMMQLKKVSSYDENNKLITTKEIYTAKGNEINYEYKYDEKGNLIETSALTDGKKTSEIKEYNSFGKVKKVVMTDFNGNKSAEKNFEYDNKGNLIKEILKTSNNLEQVSTFSNYDYIYPGEINSGGQKKIYEYDENGNATLEIMYNSGGGRQYKFINEFDERGLALKKTRYDALDKPVLIIEFKYEYYK